MNEQLCQIWRRCAPPFFAICENCYLVGVASARARSGSPSGREAAVPSIRAARVARRVRAVGRPASAIRACAGVDMVQPVTTRAAARSSLSTSSRWDVEAAGSQAPAAYSRAPLT